MKKLKSKKVNVLVIGDVILDCLTFHNRQAPYSSLFKKTNFCREIMLMGGAANVASNFKKLDTNVELIGLVGRDEESKILKNLAYKSGIDFKYVETKRVTTYKRSIYADGEFVTRVSQADNHPLTDYEEQELLFHIRRSMAVADIIVLSDYNKGVFSRSIPKACSHKDKYVAVDTKSPAFLGMKNISLLKVNYAEAEALGRRAGADFPCIDREQSIRNVSKYLWLQFGAKVLLTCDKDGSAIYDDCFKRCKAIKCNVSDTTGAGDTCIAIFSLLDYLGFDISESLFYMSLAASITVSKIGVYAPTLEEIDSASKKICGN